MPSYIPIFGFRIYLYGLLITAGFVLATLYLFKRRKVLKLKRDNILDMIILAVPCGIVGARLYYAIFNASYYFGPGNWLNIFKLREGGLAVYGGIIGGGIAFYIYSRVKKIHIGKLVDAASFGLFIGQAIGRWGNFFNREAFGVETQLPWRMGLKTYAGTIYVHPAFLYESMWNVIGFLLLHFYSKKRRRKYYGQYFFFYVAWYGLGRFFIEGIRSDSLYIPNTGIRVSQLLAIVTFVAAVAILIRNRIIGKTMPVKATGTATGKATGTRVTRNAPTSKTGQSAKNAPVKKAAASDDGVDEADVDEADGDEADVDEADGDEDTADVEEADVDEGAADAGEADVDEEAADAGEADVDEDTADADDVESTDADEANANEAAEATNNTQTNT